MPEKYNIGTALLVALMVLTLSQPNSVKADNNVFYVSPTGNDTNPGTLNAPWRTIQKAANSVQAGTIVNVRAGTYPEIITIQVSGSAQGGYITFQSYPGESAIIDGSGQTVPDDDTGLIKIADQSYIIIKDFELRNFRTTNSNRTPVGIRVIGTAHHIQLLHNRIHNIETNANNGNAHGIALHGTNGSQSLNNIVIAHNELYDLKLGSSEALVLNGNVEQFEIAYNEIHDTDNIGIDIIGWEGTSAANDQARDGAIHHNLVYNVSSYGNPAYGNEYAAAGIYVDGGREVMIEQNIIHHTDFGVELASEHQGRATSNITVRNNFIYGSNSAGIAIGGYDADRGRTEDCTIVNNTLFNNNTQQEGTGELYIQNYTYGNLIANNIFYPLSENILIWNDYQENSGNRVDYNLYFTPGGANNSTWRWKKITYSNFIAYQNATGNDAHSLFIDPDLVDITLNSPDLHLSPTSPAIDQGDQAIGSGFHDIDDGPRIVGIIDIGADETNVSNLFQNFLPIILNKGELSAS